MIKKFLLAVAGLGTFTFILPVARDGIIRSMEYGNPGTAWVYFFMTMICLAFSAGCLLAIIYPGKK